MIRRTDKFVAVLVSIIGCCTAQGKTAPPTILVIDVDNNVEYQEDISDPSKYATNAGARPSNKVSIAVQ